MDAAFTRQSRCGTWKDRIAHPAANPKGAPARGGGRNAAKLHRASPHRFCKRRSGRVRHARSGQGPRQRAAARKGYGERQRLDNRHRRRDEAGGPCGWQHAAAGARDVSDAIFVGSPKDFRKAGSSRSGILCFTARSTTARWQWNEKVDYPFNVGRRLEAPMSGDQGNAWRLEGMVSCNRHHLRNCARRGRTGALPVQRNCPL